MTPQEGLQKQLELYRQMSGMQRLQIGFELYDLSREMVQCSVRNQYPQWNAAQLENEVNRRFRLAERVHC